MMTAPKLASQDKTVHPALFMVLIAPFGATSGFFSVFIAYLLTQAKVGAEAVAMLLALSYLPQTWKFLWAPFVDLSLNRKLWYLIGLAGVVAGIALLGLSPMSEAEIPHLNVLIFGAGFASTLVAMAVESLLAHQSADEAKGRAAGWFQAGNLGGGGLGGGLALWLVESGGLSALQSSLALAGLCALCALPLLFINEGTHDGPVVRAVDKLKETLLDFWALVRSRRGALAMLICFMPLGTGSMSNMYPVIAERWHASANTVALVTGSLGGVLSALGCLVGGYVCDSMERRASYCLAGLLLALCSVGMALAPHTEWAFIGFTSLYSLLTGFAYAAFSAVALEAIGKGAAATKYNLLASLSNTPIGWMTALSGWLYARYGDTFMLFSELALAIPAILLFTLMARWSAARLQARLAAHG